MASKHPEMFKKKEGKMRKAFIVIVALLLVFTASCDGDNPTPQSTPSTSVTIPSDILENAPDNFTPVTGDKAAFVSKAIDDLMSTLLNAQEVYDLRVSGKEQNESGTLRYFMKNDGSTATVSIYFNGFSTSGYTAWGVYSTSGPVPGDMSSNTHVIDMIYTISDGTYHVATQFGPNTVTADVYLNGEKITVTEY